MSSVDLLSVAPVSKAPDPQRRGAVRVVWSLRNMTASVRMRPSRESSLSTNHQMAIVFGEINRLLLGLKRSRVRKNNGTARYGAAAG